MSFATKLSIWFILCVSIGLGVAYRDGIGLDAIIKTALAMAAIALCAVAGFWIVQRLRK